MVLGLSPEEMIGRNPLDWVHADDQAMVLEMFRGILDPSAPASSVQYRSRHADGSWRRLNSTARNLLDDPGVRGIVVSSRDVTAWEELQTRLHQSQRIEAVGRLAGGVAHDFNNLLTVVRGNAQLLLASSSFTGEQLLELEEISQAADRAAALTRQLLAFSRQQVLQPRVLDLNAVIRSMASLLERLVGEAVTLEYGLGDALWTVTADPVQVEQVLLNLVVNARDAMPAGGGLAISTTNVVANETFAQAHAPMPPGQYVCLALRDSGTGMDPATLARVFEPFFTTKALGQGSGMGLSTVYGVVKQSGGYIWVDSAVGQGTTFSIYLSRATAEARPAAPLADSEEGRRGSETILVVEDEQLVRALTRRTLERSGYRVYEASNGAEALTVARELGGGLQLVITDVVMPVMGGRELAAALRHERPSLSVLFMSGYTHEREAHLTSGGGMSHFLHKPFTLDELRNRVRLLLDLTSSAA
jgi:two-component system, cell cycle sensor histidine kinase and response regulator CckA